MTKQIRFIAYGVIIFAVLLFAWIGTPGESFVPRGVFLGNGKTFSAVNPQTVTLSQGGILGGTNVGYVNVEMYSKNATKNAVQSVEQYAKQLAAAHGATHLAVTIFGQNSQDKSIIFQAQAVHQ